MLQLIEEEIDVFSYERYTSKVPYLIDALIAGALFFLAILFGLAPTPSDLIGILTNATVSFPWDVRPFGLSIAVIMLTVATWRSWRIYKSRVLTISTQFGVGLLAFALIILKIWIFAIALDREMRKLW